MKTYEIYSGGRFTTTSQTLDVVNPFNNEVFAKTYLGSKETLEFAIEKGLAVENEMREMPTFQRYEVLQFIATEIKNNAEHLATVLCKESGKPFKFALGEINRAVQTFIAAAEESKRIPAEILSLDWTSDVQGKEGIVKFFPLGLVAGISPFNFPMNLAAHKIAPAIAAGCPIILKPATSTPLSTLELAKIIDQSSLPKGGYSVIPMDRPTGNLLVTDERFKLLTFTGSPKVGWKMKNDAGKKRVVLELGGNAGAIITENCDLEHAIKRCVIGGYAYSGQVCIHTQRIFVKKELTEKFIDAYCSAVKQLKQGDPLNKDTDVSVLIDEANAIRVEEWIKEAVQQGAKILCGGKREGAFVEPTILSNTNNKMKVNSSEVFGPVVVIESYDTFENAVGLVNDSKYGLQAGVFTNNQNEINYAFKKINVGGVIINDIPGFRTDHMPYGGIKYSGFGREGVKYSMLDMMEPKLLVKSF